MLTVGAAAPVAAVTIRGDGTRWRPSSVDIARGDRVRWRAVLGNHNVRAYGGNWTYFRAINQGESVARRFRTRGTFRFFCSIHGDVAARPVQRHVRTRPSLTGLRSRGSEGSARARRGSRRP